MTSQNQFEPVSTTRKNQFWASHNQFQSQGKMVWASYSQFQPAVRTRKNQFELVTDKKKVSQCLKNLFVCVMHNSQFQQPVTTSLSWEFQPVSQKNQFWASHNQFQSQGKMVWASYSQFQPAVRTRKNQFVCLCHAQQPVSTTSHNQFELVSTTRKNQFWASHTSFNEKWFELVTASFNKAVRSHNQFNDKEKPVWASFLRNLFVCVMHNSQFQQPGRTSLSKSQPV